MAAGDQSRRHQKSEMRLIAECPEEQAREERPSVDEECGPAEQRCGEQCILPQA